jgi:polyhydroxybutyrate depolymerase
MLLAAAPAGVKAHAEEMVIGTGDGPRTAVVLPAGDGPRPTVIVLHGALMTSEMTARFSGFAEAAAKAGFTAVFPQGLMRLWHDGRTGGPDGPDDVAFLRALLSRLVKERIGLPSHVYIAGISNGGMMSFTMVCKAGELFRGIGTVIANMPAGIGACNPPPMPLIMVNGTNDPMVPYEGGEVGLHGGRGLVMSVKETASVFVRRNGCGAAITQRLPLDSDSGFDGTGVTGIGWKECAYHKPVILYRIDGGGHQIPGRRAFLPFLFGRSNSDLPAAEAIMSAFAREEKSGWEK